MAQALDIESSRTAIERCARHPQVAGDLRCRVSAFDKAKRAANLTIRDSARSTTKVPACVASLADRTDDAFPFDLMFQLRKSGHDREQHRSHRRRRVDVTTAEI